MYSGTATIGHFPSPVPPVPPVPPKGKKKNNHGLSRVRGTAKRRPAIKPEKVLDHVFRRDGGDRRDTPTKSAVSGVPPHPTNKENCSMGEANRRKQSGSGAFWRTRMDAADAARYGVTEAHGVFFQPIDDQGRRRQLRLRPHSRNTRRQNRGKRWRSPDASMPVSRSCATPAIRRMPSRSAWAPHSRPIGASLTSAPRPAPGKPHEHHRTFHERSRTCPMNPTSAKSRSRRASCAN